MAEIRSVAVFGASGNSGDVILPALLATDLEVTVVTRENSTATFPSGVRVAKVDYTSLESLTFAIKDIDAVVSLLGPQGFQFQTRMVDAAVAAGVKYYLPSDFGHPYTDPRILPLVPAFGVKNAVLEYLKSREKDGLSWTAVVTGLWLDWGLPLDMFDIDLKGHKAKIWDGGDTAFHATNVQDIARAVTTLLVNPSARATFTNGHAYISSVETSQNEILAAAEEATESKFDVENVNGEEIFRDAEGKIAKGDYSVVKALLTGIAVSKRELCAFGEKAEIGNQVLLGGGVQEGVKEIAKRVVDGKGPEGKLVAQS